MMFPIPCDRSVRCFPCADEASNPLANLSTEDPDTNLFLSVSFRRQPNPPPNNWNQDSCVGFCESAISQEDADDCARREAFDCIINHQGPPNPTNTSWPTPTYCNQETTCQKGDECYTIPSGAVCDFSQAEADALAQSFCNYRVHDASLTGPCVVPPPEPPGPPPIPPELICPQESGAAAPDTLEITSEVAWEILTVNDSQFTAWPTLTNLKTQPFPYDHPPGHYDGKYDTGFFIRPPPCAAVDLAALIDDNWNPDSPSFNQRIAKNIYDSDPCCAGHGAAQGISFCEDTDQENEDRFQLFFNIGDPSFHVIPTKHRWKNAEMHENDGGLIRGVWDENSTQFLTSPPGFPLKFQLIQVDGLIPQPRKLTIADYDSIKLHFADQAAGNAWDGTFPERTAYNSMTVQWATTGAGAFGGAVLRSTDAHPTSANGKGWMLEVFSPGTILMYRAFKAVGATPIGVYYKDNTSTPLGPACVTCSDDSDSQWFP